MGKNSSGFDCLRAAAAVLTCDSHLRFYKAVLLSTPQERCDSTTATTTKAETERSLQTLCCFVACLLARLQQNTGCPPPLVFSVHSVKAELCLRVVASALNGCVNAAATTAGI